MSLSIRTQRTDAIAHNRKKRSALNVKISSDRTDEYDSG